MRNLILFGGTFDPPHNGHINAAINVQRHINADRFIFLPCKKPVLKEQATATPEQRVKMLELALDSVDNNYNFAIDLSEIKRSTPSYMVETLQHFRRQLGKQVAIILLMGADAFSQLPHWHEWQKLLTLANILVIERAGFTATYPDLINKLLEIHETHNANVIVQQSASFIYRYHAGSFNFSSTWIREQLSQGQDMTKFIPKPVINYIQENNLYRWKTS